MISLIEKFSCVTKFVVAVCLAVVTCFSGFSDDVFSDESIIHDIYIGCNATGEPYYELGEWYVDIRCQSSIDSTVKVKLEEFVAGGGCTNCTAMSVAECEKYKEDIVSSISDGFEFINNSRAKNEEIRNESSAVASDLAQLMYEGDQFISLSNNSQGIPSMTDIPGSTSSEKSEYLVSTPQGTYIEPRTWTAGSAYARYVQAGGVNGIYNYYTQGVKPYLEHSSYELQQLANSLESDNALLDDYETKLNTTMAYVLEIPCTACTSCGGGSGGSGSSGECPCAEVLQNIKNLVQEIRDDLRTVRQKIEKWDQRLDELRGWCNRIEAMMKVCQDALAPIGTNFVAAVAFKDLQGVSFTMQQLDKALIGNAQGFDHSVYGGLGWFSRIEYLLMSIAGVFSHTSGVPEFAVNTELADDAYNDATADQTKIEHESDSLTGGFGRVHNSAKAFFNTVSSLYSSPSGNGEIRFWDGWMDGQGLTVHIDTKIMQSCRVVTSVLWTVAFTFLLYHIVVQGCMIYGKFVMFATTANANFLK